MYRVLMCAALAVILGVPAKADEALKYRFFTHSTKQQVEDVGDVEGHVLGFARLSGQILLSDGSVGTLFWTVGFDYTKGDGPATSYGKTTLPDWSSFWWKSVGPMDKNTATTTLSITSGTGRFAGAKGDGAATGRRITIDPSGLGSEFAGEATFKIKK
jgi:hypothetical protein